MAYFFDLFPINWPFFPLIWKKLLILLLDINVPHSDCTDYDVTLVGGETGNEGKILMCLNGVWGTLCDSSFSANDAGVVCSNAGYSKSE